MRSRVLGSRVLAASEHGVPSQSCAPSQQRPRESMAPTHQCATSSILATRKAGSHSPPAGRLDAQMPTSGFFSACPPNHAATTVPSGSVTSVEAWQLRWGAGRSSVKMNSVMCIARRVASSAATAAGPSQAGVGWVVGFSSSSAIAAQTAAPAASRLRPVLQNRPVFPAEDSILGRQAGLSSVNAGAVGRCGSSPRVPRPWEKANRESECLIQYVEQGRQSVSSSAPRLIVIYKAERARHPAPRGLDRPGCREWFTRHAGSAADSAAIRRRASAARLPAAARGATAEHDVKTNLARSAPSSAKWSFYNTHHRSTYCDYFRPGLRVIPGFPNPNN